MNTVLTPQKKLEFLEHLANYPNVSAACEACGFSRTAIYGERDKDPDFAEGWERALKIGVGALEDEAHRRAFKGVMKITKFGSYLEYSDTLAIFLLKAHCPDKYMDKVRSELTGANGEPLNLTEDQISAKLAAIMQAGIARRDNAVAPPEASDDDYDDLC